MSLFEPDPLASLRKTASAHWPSECVRKRSKNSSDSSISWGRESRCGCKSSAISWVRSSCGDRPGVGKTTLARIIARLTHCDYIPFSAVLSGIKEIKAVMADAERNRRVGRRTLIFIDEIHRFNKAQQDAFLPYVERGDISLIGATTENPVV